RVWYPYGSYLTASGS
nr:Chain P, 15-mer peptide [synthetic construct]1JYC_Q Chain Q, 15-mer peptide [synthetic construct]1JYC_R Chain R, 15-mer peptide [synthetic construct]1JYC_S Chain S, 15-mer peptide [synthetic construct]